VYTLLASNRVIGSASGETMSDQTRHSRQPLQENFYQSGAVH